MPLYIRDDKVDELATKFMRLTGARNKTDAVRKALIAQIAAESNCKPLLERLEPILQRSDALGSRNSDFKMKKFTDEMWSDI